MDQSAEIQGAQQVVSEFRQGSGLQIEQSQLQKHLLAQEVVKLRREVAELRASAAVVPLQSDDDPHIARAKLEVATLEAQKTEVIAQTNAQKALLAKEVKHLRSEIDLTRAKAAAAQPAVINSGDQNKEIIEALQRRKEFEENFTRTLRDLRKELEQTSIKSINAKNQLPLGVRSMIQLSNERIEKVMEEAAQVPVEERLHIEALRLLIENSKLRKTLNDYSEGILHNTLSKVESTTQRVRNLI